MNHQKQESSRAASPKIFIAWAIALLGGISGTAIGRMFASAIQTNPAWIGPAILIGSIALILIAVLLSPAAIRYLKSRNSSPTV